jgi:hypothetical protein
MRYQNVCQPLFLQRGSACMKRPSADAEYTSDMRRSGHVLTITLVPTYNHENRYINENRSIPLPYTYYRYLDMMYHHMWKIGAILYDLKDPQRSTLLL